MASKEEILEALEKSLVPMDEAIATALIMIYGESGVGKTKAAVEIAKAVCPPDKFILYIDAVQGWVTLNNHPELKQNVKLMRYEGSSQLNAVINATNAKVGQWANVGVVVYDEISTMMKKDLDIVLAANSKKDRGKDPDRPTIVDFFANTERFRKLVLGGGDYPGTLNMQGVSQIYVAHERHDKDDSTGVVHTRPAFMPKFSETLRENIHVCAHMTATEKVIDDQAVYERSFQVHPSKRVVAKSRVGDLDVHVSPEKFTTQLIKWMQGSIKDQDESAIRLVEDAIENPSEEEDDLSIELE